ncbi:MAG TPA: hypothetical protein VM509_07995 [Planctomycetota bacterium]|nr:hypothetical protein [Planctomycetota bacterium]
MLAWLAWVAPVSGAVLGAANVDPLRFGAVAPALWAVALALSEAAAERASLPTPAWGALAWTGLFYAGMSVGALGRREATFSASAAARVASVALVAALLIGLPTRGGVETTPWPPRAASVLLDVSPFVFLGECSGVRDMAWHRSFYSTVGTDRFQRSPWNAPWAAGSLFAVGLCCAWLADRRRSCARDVEPAASPG